jgi:hypothetical protein
MGARARLKGVAVSAADRELLEMTAKAACYKLMWSTVEDLSPRLSDSFDVWNPLADDGDALRLAVKLRFEIDVCHTGVVVRTPNGHTVLVDCDCTSDAQLAARLAIVRAAAEIGKGMP